MGCIYLFGLLLIIGGVLSQEECQNKCAGNFSDEKEVSSCKEGCRLAVIFNFAPRDGLASTNSDCRDGCNKSYDEEELKAACSFGCDSQPQLNQGRVHVSISNKDPTFNVARGAMNRMFSRFANFFPSFESDSSEKSSEEDDEDPFSEMHRHMQREMARLHAVASRLFNNAQFGVLDYPQVQINRMNRPHGHIQSSLDGPEVGNRYKDGSTIIEAKMSPDGLSEMQSTRLKERLLGHQGENPITTDVEEQSWLSWLAMRARRMSVVTQWLIIVALLLCFISLLSISLAIFKHLWIAKRRNYPNARVVFPAKFGEPLPAKKIPLESPSAAMDYPLIHDSPPPAYDQLSVHKEKIDEKEKPVE